MANRYVATIMNRLFLGDNNYIYYLSHTTVGDYDPKTQIFKDRNGNEYLPITEPNLLMSEVSTAYANLEDVRRLPRLLGCDKMKDAISDYNYYCSRFIYYVSRTDNNMIFCIPIDYIQMKENITRSLEAIKENGGLDAVAEGRKVVTSPNQETYGKDDEEEEDPLVRESSILSEDVRAEIAAFLMNMMDGVYSLEELKELRENILKQREDIDSLVDSIDLQIEASEKGESSIQLKGEGKKKTHTFEETIKKDQAVKKVHLDHYINLDELFKKVTRTLIAQDEPTRRVITEIARKEQNARSKNRGLLITGPTGSGKTKMMELIAKNLDKPFFKVDSTQLTIPGYVGKDIEEVLWELYLACGKDKEKAEHAIIFFDEIDKKGSSRKDDISGKGVLNILLPFIEGSTYNATENVKYQKEVVPISTKNMIVILGGAFTDVYKELREKNAIGFGTNPVKNGTPREATTQDFVEKAQMPDEFMGRVSIIKLNDLDVEAIKRILRESDESALKLQEKLFQELGVRLTASEGYINAIAEQAEKRGTGARGLNTVVDETTWEAYGDAYSHLGEYDEIILEEDTVKDPKVYKKIPKKESNQ